MIDLHLLRDDPDRLRRSQRARGADPALVDAAVAADVARREAVGRATELRAQQKALGKGVAAAPTAERQELLARLGELAAAVKQAEKLEHDAEAQARAALLRLDNVVEPDAPEGGEDDYVVLREVGTPPAFEPGEFHDHVEIGARLRAVDLDRAAKTSGTRFYYLTGIGALLELALINFAVAHALDWGFTPVVPPVLVRREAMEGTGFLGRDEQQVFAMRDDDLYLVGTSEVPLASYHAGEILDLSAGPLRYAGISACFRREAGSYGKDTRGIIRVHQFDKVEMFSFCPPEDSPAEHLRLLAWEERLLQALELPYRVVDVAAGDLGASAARKYDCEAWIPTQGRYREVTSTSNCTDFQARRLGIRMRGADGRPRHVHTLNGTLVAVPRTIVALFENHQQPDGSVVVPTALRPFLGGRELLAPA